MTAIQSQNRAATVRKITARKVVVLATILWGLAVFAAAGSSFAEEPSGKDIFLAQKCNLCHAIESQGIEKRSKSDSEATQGAELSDVGNRHEGEWLKAFLTKKETLKGEPHKKGFRGSDEELQALVDWLGELKAAEGEGAKDESAGSR